MRVREALWATVVWTKVRTKTCQVAIIPCFGPVLFLSVTCAADCRCLIYQPHVTNDAKGWVAPTWETRHMRPRGARLR
jgi:hypothetical protein